MTALDRALTVAAKGWRVFPVGGATGKVALVPWKRNATSNARAVRQLWRSHPEANVGIALPEGTIVVDVDDLAAFTATGLVLPEAPGQATPSGGFHRLFSTNGHSAAQTVKATPGIDTRVGGKGYIVAWEPEALPEAGTLPPAPAWVYGTTRRLRVSFSAEPITEGARDQALTSLAGSMRDRGMSEDAILAALTVENTTRCVPPLPDRDLQRIAHSVARYRPENAPKVGTALSEVTIVSATDLMARAFPDLQWAIERVLREVAAVLAAAPKIGKSWMVDDWALAIASGGLAMQAVKVDRGQVLLLPLEDSQRRLQSRLLTLLHGREVPPLLDIAFDWPRFGEGFEEQINGWITGHDHARLIVVDTLAKVRPPSTGRRQLYEVDYEDMSVLASIVKAKPGLALAVVHHDRKAEADDFLDSVSGSHGITGASDTVLVLRRSRGSGDAVLHVTGRDVEEDAHALTFTAGRWEMTNDPIPDAGQERNAIALWLGEHGPAGPGDVARALGRPRGSTRMLMADMKKDGQLAGGGQAYRVPFTVRTRPHETH